MPAPARTAAYRALRLIFEDALDLGEALARTRDKLGDARDRALATDLVTGTLRWRGAIDYQLARLSARPLERLDAEVLDALRMGAYQILYLERVPVSAVINDTVSIVKAARVKSAAPFVNAVLRRLVRQRGTLGWPDDLAVVHSHPSWLVARWIDRYGRSAAEEWLRFNNRPPMLTLVTNRLRFSREALQAALRAEEVETEPTRLAPYGLRVREGKALSSRAFRDGACLVQDEASQLISELVAARPGDRVLDACAAPGGKTLALAAQVSPRGRVIATDVRRRRMRVLAATLQRCAVSHARLVHVSDAGPLPFRDAVFDAVLVDAPCSGLGTVRRDPDIRWRRQPADLGRFAAAQRALLARVAPLVKPGGRLVYSTCSSEPEENEDVVAAFLSSDTAFDLRPLSTLEGIPAAVRALATSDGFLRTDPARDGLEAFFGAVFERGPRS